MAEFVIQNEIDRVSVIAVNKSELFIVKNICIMLPVYDVCFCSNKLAAMK